jgi:hypothetical protein
MLDARRRPEGRFFCGLGMLLLVWFGLMQGPSANAADLGVATTRVSDTVYRADGTPASGTVLISWPAFTTSEAVANREIVDEIKFKDGLGKIIDGTVECLNASAWSHLEARK